MHGMRLLSVVAGLTITTTTASVVILPGGTPRPYKESWDALASTSTDTFFRESVPAEFLQNQTKLILSSFDDNPITPSSNIHASADSFLRGAIQAWGEHHHLVIRPDEVWFSILVQMNFYMGSHAEEIRDLFVDHEGKETIYVEDVTWYRVLESFQYAIQEKIKTDWLREWIIPAFSTTTETDRMTANILMMGLMKSYFDLTGGIICGLPSVTLLGTRDDWVTILDRLARLDDFGPEAKSYRQRLEPVLSRFVTSFEDPDSESTREFWRNIVIVQEGTICGAPPFMVSGWITAFWHWDDLGEAFAQGDGGFLRLDNVTYDAVDIRQLPVAYATVPFTMIDYGGVDKFEAYVLAGNLGKRITRGAPEGYVEALARVSAAKGKPGGYGDGGEDEDDEVEVGEIAPGDQSTLEPLSAWMLYGPLPHDTDPETRIPRDSEIGYLSGYIRADLPSCPVGQRVKSTDDLGF